MGGAGLEISFYYKNGARYVTRISEQRVLLLPNDLNQKETISLYWVDQGIAHVFWSKNFSCRMGAKFGKGKKN